MYIVSGIYAPDRAPAGRGRAPAELRFESLDQAMQKLRDWVEADELDCATGGDGPMFIEYAIRIEPLPASHHAAVETPAENPPHSDRWPPLRLA